MISFAVEPWDFAKAEILALGPEHVAEVGQFRDSGVLLEMDLHWYAAHEALGKLHVVVGRDASAVVAYHVSVLGTMPHYTSVFAARGDFYFMRKPWRVGRNVLRFFEFVHRSLADRAVDALYEGLKLDHDHGELFEALGMKPLERIYFKWLTLDWKPPRKSTGA